MGKVAVIGVGRMGARHLASLCKLLGEGQVLAIDEPARLGERIGNVELNSMDALFGEQHQIDYVVIAVPTKRHRSVAEIAINAGCNVVLEKPFTASVSDVVALSAMASSKGVSFRPAFVERFNPAIIALSAFLQTDHGLGKMLDWQSRRIGLAPEVQGDVCDDLGSHDLDLLRFLSGSEIEGVKSEYSPHLDYRHAKISGQLANHALFSILVSYAAPVKERKIEIFFERGAVILDLLRMKAVTFHHESLSTVDWPEFGQAFGGVLPATQELNVEVHEPLVKMHEALLRRGSLSSSTATSEDGLQMVKALEAARG